MESRRPTIMEIDLNNFKYNVNQIKKYVNSDVKLMPIIKANAYGTWINKRLEILNEFEIVAVATVDEAVQIRDLGYEKEIFILNQPYIDEIEKVANYNITVGVCSEEFIKALKNVNKKVKVHIEIETGMGRTGVKVENLKQFIFMIKEIDNIEIEGVYTHFSSADYDDEFTKKQYSIFNKAVDISKNILVNLKYIHCSASNAIINYPNNCFNLVRPGIILYGYKPFENALEKLNLKPVATLKSKIVFLKEVKENIPISYSQTFITKRKTKVATIPIGYADGLRRILSNRGEVVINNKKVPIIGNICMDSFMVDVTDVDNVKIGDDVYIWDNKNITLEEIANKCNTINYEILSTISSRVPRVFI